MGSMTDFIRKHPLAAIVAAFVAIATVHVLISRGLFFDEAIYFVIGKTIGLRGENWNFENWVVGSPWAYPGLVVGTILKILSALGLDGVDWTNVAVAAVREANVVFMAIVVVLVYRIATLLWNRTAALWSAAVFAATGCVVFLSGFATYDTLSLLFTAISLWLLVEATHEGRPTWIRIGAMALAGVAFGLAWIVKYIVLVFIPGFLGILAVRMVELPITKPALTKFFAHAALWSTAAGITACTHLIPHWEALKLVFLYGGGHTARYGATGEVILVEVLYFVGFLWLFAGIGLASVERKWLVGLMLLGVSFTTPVYHLVFRDPLALFKQMAWTALFASLLAGLAFEWLASRTRFAVAVSVFAVFAVFGLYQVRSLEQFYPDPDPAAAWLQENVSSEDCNILVDDVWAYRWALNHTFDGKEWCVTDQWWWYGSLATEDFWVDAVNQGYFPYIVLERDGAFMGEYTVFSYKVADAIVASGRYELVQSFPSYVTWGNAILPPGYNGRLVPHSVVTTEIWKRIPTAP